MASGFSKIVSGRLTLEVMFVGRALTRLNLEGNGRVLDAGADRESNLEKSGR